MNFVSYLLYILVDFGIIESFCVTLVLSTFLQGLMVHIHEYHKYSRE